MRAGIVARRGDAELRAAVDARARTHESQWASMAEVDVDKRTVGALKSWCKMLVVKYHSKSTKPHFEKALLDAKRCATSTTLPKGAALAGEVVHVVDGADVVGSLARFRQ